MTPGLESVEQFQQRDPDRHRVRCWLRRRSCLHLVEDTVRKEHLIFVTADLDNDGIRDGSEELRKQGRLTGPGLALQMDDLWVTHLGRRESLSKDG